MIENIRMLLAEDIRSLDALIIQQLHSRVDLVENIGHYIIDAGGKRLRPLLAILCMRAAEEKLSADRATLGIQFAGIIEFIHTATLLHDDVVDISSLRRGRPTANAEFGNASSVLVGDFIYSRAFQMLVTVAELPIMALMSDATNQIAEGEVLQLTKAGDANTSESDYLQVITDKTAILFAAAMQGGAMLAGLSQSKSEKLAEYGLNLGIAFQIADDILDYQGDANVMGKNVGDDLNEGKPTLPLIYTMANGNAYEKALVVKAITEKSNDNIDEILDIIQANGALDYCRAMAFEYVEKAKAVLSVLDDSAYKQALISITEFAVNRVK
jgi:octaprenyl-diphosphate synthase